MSAATLTTIPSLEVVLFCKAFVTLRSEVIITGFQRDSFSKCAHSTKILFSYLEPMIVVVNRYLLPRGTYGMTLWPFILVRESHLRRDPVLINHERIHLRQQLQLLIIPFYLWYGIEFGLRWLKYGNRKKAYSNLSMEREAYANETDLDYLQTFRLWSFIRYL